MISCMLPFFIVYGAMYYDEPKAVSETLMFLPEDYSMERCVQICIMNNK